MSSEESQPIKSFIANVLDKKTGVTYLEERQVQYVPEKGYNRILSSRRTGYKILPGTDEVVPCRPKRPAKTKQPEEPPAAVNNEQPQQEQKPQEEPSEPEKNTKADWMMASRSRTGATEILDWVGKHSGLDDAVHAAFPAVATADKIISVARYLVVSGDTVNNIDYWQYEHDLPYVFGMSEDSCYDLFAKVGLNEAGIQGLFQKLAAIGGKNQNILAFDSTTRSTYAKGDLKPFARKGFNKDHDGLDSYKLLTFYSIDSRLPVSFEFQPGNIPDVSSLLNALTRLKTYGLKKPEIVMDNGFHSKQNICTMCRENVRFLIRGNVTDKWIYQHIDPDTETGRLGRAEFTVYGNRCPFESNITAYSVRSMTTFEWKRERSRGDKAAGQTEAKDFRLYFHFYYDKTRATEYEVALLDRLQRLKERIESEEQSFNEQEQAMIQEFLYVKKVRGGRIKVTLNETALAEDIRDAGIFVLISNCEKDPWIALRRYRLRNVIESSYRVIKSEIDGRHPRVWTERSDRGKEVCRLIALGYRFYLLDAINRAITNARTKAKDDSLGKIEKDLYSKVASWLRDCSVRSLLRWFDCVQTVNLQNSRAKYRWST